LCAGRHCTMNQSYSTPCTPNTPGTPPGWTPWYGHGSQMAAQYLVRVPHGTPGSYGARTTSPETTNHDLTVMTYITTTSNTTVLVHIGQVLELAAASDVYHGRWLHVCVADSRHRGARFVTGVPWHTGDHCACSHDVHGGRKACRQPSAQHAVRGAVSALAHQSARSGAPTCR
jgi:hypothetical protein